MVGMTKKKTAFWVAVFLLPNLIGFFTFIVFPLLSSLAISFTNWDLISTMEFVGIDNYKQLIGDKEFWAAFTHTITFIIGYLPLVMIFGLASALLLNRKVKLREIGRAHV